MDGALLDPDASFARDELPAGFWDDWEEASPLPTGEAPSAGVPADPKPPPSGAPNRKAADRAAEVGPDADPERYLQTLFPGHVVTIESDDDDAADGAAPDGDAPDETDPAARGPLFDDD